MATRARWISAAVLVTAAAAPGPAADPLTRPEVAKIGKAGTALVVTKGRDANGVTFSAHGSAFCVHPSGLFVTSGHAAQGGVTLVLSPGLKDEKAYPAAVVRSDPGADLALLRIDGAKGLSALALGADDKVAELDDVVTVGFPFEAAPGPGPKANPEVSVNVGTVTALRRKDGALDRIQVDAALSPGSSGGPVLDRGGRVVGVVAAGVRGSGAHFAVPVGAVARFLSAPDVHFDPPTLTPRTVLKPSLFEARIVPLVPPATTLSVELVLEQPGGPKRAYQMEAQGDKYRATVAPVVPAQGPQQVRLSARFADGQVNGTTADRAIKVGDHGVQIGELHSVRMGSNPLAILADGKRTEGLVSGLADVPVQLGGQTLRMNLDRAIEVRFSPAVGAERVEYTLIIRQGKDELHRVSGPLPARGFLTAAGDGPRGAGITPPLLEGDKVVRKLSAPVTDAAAAGGGRYLILRLDREQRLAVFDVCASEVIGFIPLRDPAARFTAGLEYVIVVLPGTGKIERWDLQTMERVAVAPVPVAGKVRAVVMGAASRGPLLVHWSRGAAPLDEAPLSLVDPNTFAVTEQNVKAPTSGGESRYRDHLHLRASAGGRAFGAWRSHVSPSGYGTIVVTETGTESFYNHTDLGHIVPGPNGKTVFTGAGKQALKVSPTQDLSRGDREIPACQGDCFLTLPAGRAAGPVYVGRLGQARPIATVTDVDAVAPDEPNMDHDFTADKRVHLIPDAGLIIVIPPTNDRLVLHRYGG